MFVQGHANNSITRIPKSMKGLKALELLASPRPHQTTWASLAIEAGRTDAHVPLTGSDAVRMQGLAGRFEPRSPMGRQIVKPIFKSKDDLEVMYLIAKKLGLAEPMFKNISKVKCPALPVPFSGIQFL